MTRFPPDFLWGTATAAHQIEGGNVNSDFWLAENVPETIFREPSGDACDSYHRYGDDIALAAELGFNTHRFGIEWARIEPEPGVFSRAALDHYLRVLECCHLHGLAPMVSLSHWTVPRWFAARGGFEQADSPELFARFAEQVGRHLGDGMAYVTTFNEANIQRVIGSSFHNPKVAPRLAAMKQACARACGSDRFSMVLFATSAEIEDQLVASHHRAAEALRAGPGSFQLGVTISRHLRTIYTARGWKWPRPQTLSGCRPTPATGSDPKAACACPMMRCAQTWVTSTGPKRLRPRCGSPQRGSGDRSSSPSTASRPATTRAASR
jgi:beta-glucosidase